MSVCETAYILNYWQLREFELQLRTPTLVHIVCVCGNPRLEFTC